MPPQDDPNIMHIFQNILSRRNSSFQKQKKLILWRLLRDKKYLSLGGRLNNLKLVDIKRIVGGTITLEDFTFNVIDSLFEKRPELNLAGVLGMDILARADEVSWAIKTDNSGSLYFGPHVELDLAKYKKLSVSFAKKRRSSLCTWQNWKYTNRFSFRYRCSFFYYF